MADETKIWSPFPEVRPLESPEVDLEDCRKCEGYGIVLGTETEDSWGDLCTCGRPSLCPTNPREAQELTAAHEKARLKRAVSHHMQVVDRVMGALLRSSNG